jgi:dihydrofolate synthase/folylpolyglutamate synthase
MHTIEQRYQQTLDYIYSFVDYSRTHQENLRPENFDLSRMRRFMDLLGNPQDQYPSLHIAGSKGKGSVSAFCASVYQQAGYRVGLYISPHLKDFEERMQVNGIPISRVALVEMVEEIRPAIEAVEKLTTFEIMTGMAFLHFFREGIDIAVIEVGLGGRLDATNVITPVVSVITSLYLEHTSILGDTIEKIAGEKGGIIKENVPVVTAPQKQEALQVLKHIAGERHAPLIEVGRDYPYAILEADLDGQLFRIAKEMGQAAFPSEEFLIPLLGKYQVDNAAVAFAALDTARQQGFSLEIEEIRAGFRKTNWPARFEIARREPPLIFDSAHNPDSIEKLRQTLDEFFPGYPLIVVFGISADKQLGGMYRALLPRAEYLITSQAEHPRAMDAHQLLAEAEEYQISGEAVPAVGEALARALEIAGKDKMVLVTGSIFVAATARIAWGEWGQQAG